MLHMVLLQIVLGTFPPNHTLIDDLRDSELYLDGYDMYREDKKPGKGGGILLYVKDTLKSVRFNKLASVGFEQSIWCIVELKSSRYLIGTCYRSPSSSAENGERLLELLDAAVKQSRVSNVMVIGDFNYPDIDYERFYVSAGPHSEQQKFFDRTQDLFLCQHVNKPTRCRGGSSSCLDYIFTTDENVIDNLQYEVPLGTSDHACLVWELAVEVQETVSSVQQKLNYWKADYDSISKALKSISWEDSFQSHSVEGMWSIFRDTLNDLVKKHVPMKPVQNRPRKSRWLSKRTLRNMKWRNKQWKKYRLYPSVKNYEIYRKARNTVNSLVKEDRLRHQHRVIQSFKGNPKKFYAYMRQAQTVKSEVTQLEYGDGELTATHLQAANVLCETFQKCFTRNDHADSVQ